MSQSAPRRKLLQYLRQFAKIDEVPEKTIVERIPDTQLTVDEVMFLIRLRGILVDDYSCRASMRAWRRSATE